MSTPLLSLERVTTGYTQLDVIHEVSLRVDDRSIVAILGPNGAGKTALMRAVSGLNRVRAGRVMFDGEDLARAHAADVVSRGVIHVPQGRALFGAMTVRENLEMGAYLLGDGVERRRRLDNVFELFPVLKERAWQAAAYLSGGEQQMLAIGRALMSRPRLLLLDEPSLGLAPRVFDDILARVKEIHAAGASILIAEQSVRKVLRIAHYGYVLENGAIALEGTGDELARDARVERAYLASAAHASTD